MRLLWWKGIPDFMGRLTVLGANEHWWTLWSTYEEEPRNKSTTSPKSSLGQSVTWLSVRSGWSWLTHTRNSRTCIGGPFLPFHVPRCAPLPLPHFPHDRADRLKCRSSTIQSDAPAVIGATPSTILSRSAPSHAEKAASARDVARRATPRSTAHNVSWAKGKTTTSHQRRT